MGEGGGGGGGGGVTYPPHMQTKKNQIKYTIYEEKSQMEKRWERRCVEVQQEGKGKEGEKRRKEKERKKRKEEKKMRKK